MPERDELEAIGSEGSLFLDDPWHCNKPVIEVRRADGVERIEIEHEDSYRLELENVSAAVRGEAELLLGREDAVGQARALEALHASATDGGRGEALARRFDRAQRELLVDLAGQPADADRAQPRLAVEDRDAAEEEREERVEARPLDGVVPDLLRQLARRARVAAGGRIRLALGVQARIRGCTVHRRRRDQLAVGVRDEDRDRRGRLRDDEVDDRASACELHPAIVIRPAPGYHRRPMAAVAIPRPKTIRHAVSSLPKLQ